MAALLIASCVVVVGFVAAISGRGASTATPDGRLQWGCELPVELARATTRVFVTGDTRGYIHPCGCEEGLFGGLPRRASFLSAVRQPQDLLLDLGNLIEGTRPHERLKLNFLLEGLKRLRYDVLVPGEGELALGEDFEKLALKLAQPHVVCANLVRAGSGERVFDPWHIKRLPGGTRIAIVGLTSPYQQLPKTLEARAPAEALQDALDGLGDKADAVIVAGYLDGKLAFDLAAAFPGVSAVIAARVPRGSEALIRRGGAPVMVGGQRGQYVSAIGLDDRGAARDGARYWLGESVPDSPDMAALVRRHDEEAKQFGEAFARESMAAFRADSWIGSTACAECHQAEYDSWKKSKHAHAMAALRSKKQHANPNCMQCHLQDLSADETENHDIGVGCESCHGGGRTHVIAVRSPSAVPVRSFRTPAINGCVNCHDEANSPKFERHEYWRRIAHGPAQGERE